MPNLTNLGLGSNQLSNIESGAFNGLLNLRFLTLDDNPSLTALNLQRADFSSLTSFDVEGNVHIARVSLRNTVVNPMSFATLLDGGPDTFGRTNTGIGELDATITKMGKVSGIDFVDITDLEPLYVMDDLTDLWLVDAKNLDATALDVLLASRFDVAADMNGDGVVNGLDVDPLRNNSTSSWSRSRAGDGPCSCRVMRFRRSSGSATEWASSGKGGWWPWSGSRRSRPRWGRSLRCTLCRLQLSIEGDCPVTPGIPAGIG